MRDQCVLITGAGGRLGRAMIQAVQKQKGMVFFTEQDEASVARTEQACPGAHGFITSGRDVEELLSQLDQRQIVPHMLVNNIGISAEKTFWDESTAEWEKIFKTNVILPVSLSKVIAKRMIDRKYSGNILFISSVHQALPSRWPSYSASKAALRMVIKELAIEFSGDQIRVNGIAPGWVEPETHYFKMALLERRTIDPEYIAHAVVFLGSSDLSRFTTGTVLTIDAGMSLYSGRTVVQPPHPEK